MAAAERALHETAQPGVLRRHREPRRTAAGARQVGPSCSAGPRRTGHLLRPVVAGDQSRCTSSTGLPEQEAVRLGPGPSSSAMNEHRQRFGEVRDDVEGPVGREVGGAVVDMQAVGRFDPSPRREHVAAAEGALHEPAQPGVLRAARCRSSTRLRTGKIRAEAGKHSAAAMSPASDPDRGADRRTARRLRRAPRGGRVVRRHRDLAEPLPALVIAELLGWPEADRHLLRPWSQAIVKMVSSNRTPEQEAEAVAASAEFAVYVENLAAERVSGPATTSSRTWWSRPSDRLSTELVATAVLLLNAGHEASVNGFGNGLATLLASGAEPGGPERLVEEMLRHDSPLQLFERTATREVTIGGVPWSRARRSPPSWAPPTATRPCSTRPTSSVPTVTRTRTSRSELASTSASARRSPGWINSRALLARYGGGGRGRRPPTDLRPPRVRRLALDLRDDPPEVGGGPGHGSSATALWSASARGRPPGRRWPARSRNPTAATASRCRSRCVWRKESTATWAVRSQLPSEPGRRRDLFPVCDQRFPPGAGPRRCARSPRPRQPSRPAGSG